MSGGRVAIEIVGGILAAAVVWYVEIRLVIGFNTAANMFHSSAHWWSVAMGLVALVSSIIFLWPIASLAGGLLMTATIVLVRTGVFFPGLGSDESIRQSILVGAYEQVTMVLAAVWIGAGVIGLLRRSLARRSATRS